MSFSYGSGSNPSIDYVRLLVADTDPATPIFEDSEIATAFSINSATFQSSMLYSGQGGANLPSTPSNYLRAAALLLRALAANKARLASVQGVLDVKQNPAAAAKALNDLAQAYFDMDDNSGAFFIAEQVNTVFSFRDRFWNQVQRQSGGGI